MARAQEHLQIPARPHTLVWDMQQTRLEQSDGMGEGDGAGTNPWQAAVAWGYPARLWTREYRVWEHRL